MQLHSCDLGIERTTRADHEACAALIRSGSKSFSAASRLLPARVRNSALALYAFCRLADDSVDMGSSETRVDQLRERLALIYAGRPRNSAADRALADVVVRHSIPKALLEALLEGFEWDLQRRRYVDLEDLRAYAVRVAGSVGVMMACIMDTRSAVAMARACDLGVAMQLTNIARDVGEDARAGRLYLPTSWLVAVGVDPDLWLSKPVFSVELGSVVNRVLEAAEILYARSTEGIALLPGDCRLAIYAARALYAEIGHELQRSRYDSVARRTVVPAHRKARVLARAWLDCSRGGLDQRVQWLLQLFERLERRDRGAVDKTA